MPHPERVFRNVQMSWAAGEVSAPSPVDAHVPQREERLEMSGLTARAELPSPVHQGA